MKITTKIEGLDRALASVNHLKKTFKNKILRKAMRAGAKPIQALAKSFCKVQAVAKTIKVGVRTKRGKVQARVFSRHPIAHLVELGTKGSVAGVAKGRSTGKKVLTVKVSGNVFLRKTSRPVHPRPYLVPALTQGGAAAVAEIERVITEELTKLTPLELARAIDIR